MGDPPHLWCGIAIMSGVVVLGRSGIRDFLGIQAPPEFGISSPQIKNNTKHALHGCSPRVDLNNTSHQGLHTSWSPQMIHQWSPLVISTVLSTDDQ